MQYVCDQHYIIIKHPHTLSPRLKKSNKKKSGENMTWSVEVFHFDTATTLKNQAKAALADKG